MLDGQLVGIYRNLNKQCYSVKAMQGESKNKVIGYISYDDDFILTDVKFKVSTAGRNRVLKEKSKNVHAMVVGVLYREGFCKLCSEEITYNPYVAPTFYIKSSEKAIEGASVVYFTGKKLMIAENIYVTR